MKVRSVFTCQQCGSQSQKWLGRCPDCGAWNSFEEERTGATEPASTTSPLGNRTAVRFADVDRVVAERLTTGISEFDRVRLK